jgi:hypothetical protein
MSRRASSSDSGVPRPNALSFERFVPAFDLSVRLGIVRRGSDVRHARDPDELLEVLGDELEPLSEMIRGRASGVRFLGALLDDLDIRSVIDSRRSQLTM